MTCIENILHIVEEVGSNLQKKKKCVRYFMLSEERKIIYFLADSGIKTWISELYVPEVCAIVLSHASSLQRS